MKHSKDEGEQDSMSNEQALRALHELARRTLPRCPRCATELEVVAESSGTGVFHPDGAQESEWVEGSWCPRCLILIAEGEEAYDLGDFLEAGISEEDHLLDYAEAMRTFHGKD